MFQVLNGRVPLHCGLDRARILTRDLARYRTYYHVGKISTVFENDHLVENCAGYRADLHLESEHVRVCLTAKLPSLPYLPYWRRARTFARDWIQDVYGRGYSLRSRRVFGIGFQRTGTTSLAAALRMLGLFTVDHAPWTAEAAQRGDLDWEIFDEYTAFTDNPFSVLFQELDQRFPGSRFILTMRDTESWLHSERWLLEGVNRGHVFPMEEWIYGIKGFDETRFRTVYEAHRSRVQDYFQNRSDDLLVFSVRDGWEPLCRFLKLPVPDAPFPMFNRAPRWAKAIRRFRRGAFTAKV